MVMKRLRAVGLFAILTGAFACHKNQDATPAPPPPAVLPVNVQFEFGAGNSPITIDSTSKILRNLPAGCNLQQLTATVGIAFRIHHISRPVYSTGLYQGYELYDQGFTRKLYDRS